MLILSGGENGGLEVDATGWTIGEERQINGAIYRRASDEQAIFVGAA